MAAKMLALLTLMVIFGTVSYAIYKPPVALIRYFENKWPDVLWHVETKSKIVALTIDDAPSQYTHEILRILQANEATATFFVIGSQIPGHEGVLKELVIAGNELANHAMFDEPSRRLPQDQLIQQVKSVQQQLSDIYSTTESTKCPMYFRPGSGFFSTDMRTTLPLLGYQIVLGDIFPFDPFIPFWRVNANHILSMLRPGGIIICHDRRSWTIPMLRHVLPEMKKRGYRVVTLGELQMRQQD